MFDWSAWSSLVSLLLLIGHPEKIPDPPPEFRALVAALAIHQMAQGLAEEARGAVQRVALAEVGRLAQTLAKG